MNDAAAHSSADWSLECVGLSVRLGGRLVVNDVSLSLRAGQCVSIVGPNGSGKTTLLLALLGLLSPAAGSVRFNGRDLRRLSARARGRVAAYVPQMVDLVPAFRVYDVVAGGRFAHVPTLGSLSDEDHAAVARALSQCGLAELAQRTFDTLSGGERRKTLLAAAIAQDPHVMMLDEPNTALDPAYQIELVRILHGWRCGQRGLLLVSHELQLPAALGGRVIALRAGRVSADGPAEETLTPQTLSEIYSAPFGTVTTEGGRRIVLPEWW